MLPKHAMSEPFLNLLAKEEDKENSQLELPARLEQTEMASTCNLLTALKNCCNVVVLKSNTSVTAQNRLCSSMEGFIEHCNKDHIRNTMMKHEEIFRHQVHELHRLYEVQKLLMEENESRKLKFQSHENATSRAISNSVPNARDWISLSVSETCHISCQSTDHMNPEFRYMLSSGDRLGLSSRDLTVRGEDDRRVHRGFDLERPAEEFNLTSAEAWSIQDHQALMFGKQLRENSTLKCPQRSWTDDESGIQLTLSMACGTEKKRSTDFAASKY
ncbi:hypothetical protein Cni_G00799 [Canna indica]|uniref:Uncharacterized protein n=1 Tax=Canna indica TaxID=4628 RepID=A0AAQ3PXQ8_9LILI|nr:hypothetical protein Cni_G00799 [Canna indica]